MSDDPQQDRYSDQCELFYSAKTESIEVRESVPHAIGQQARNRDFDERVEDPQHQDREREAQFQDTFRGVPEPAIGRQSQKVLEIRRKGSDYNG